MDLASGDECAVDGTDQFIYDDDRPYIHVVITRRIHPSDCRYVCCCRSSEPFDRFRYDTRDRVYISSHHVYRRVVPETTLRSSGIFEFARPRD